MGTYVTYGLSLSLSLYLCIYIYTDTYLGIVMDSYTILNPYIW